MAPRRRDARAARPLIPKHESEEHAGPGELRPGRAAARAVPSLDAWSEEHLELVRKIVVPAGLKWEVRDKLDQANVTERVLFPGLDGLSRWLARQYVPRVR